MLKHVHTNVLYIKHTTNWIKQRREKYLHDKMLSYNLLIFKTSRM